MDETIFYASATASPVILPYAYLFGGSHSLFVSIFACLFTLPCCAFKTLSLRSRNISRSTRYTLLIPLCIPLAYTLCPRGQKDNSFGWDYPSIFLILFATLLGVKNCLSTSNAPLKIPPVCVSTRRRIANVVSSQLLFFLSPSVLISRTSSIVTVIIMASILTVPLTRNWGSSGILKLTKDTFCEMVTMHVFYETCLATTRLFSTLPPLRLNGKTICEGLATGKRISWWESCLFVNSGRANREWVWAISPIGGRVLNWNAMVSPALLCIRTATLQLEQAEARKNRANLGVGSPHQLAGGDNNNIRVRYNSWKKPQTIQLDDLEQVLWSLDTITTLVYCAYLEDKNGVTQVHFREITDTLFALEAIVMQLGGPVALHDRIHNSLYKICTRYSSAVYSLDMDHKYLDRFISYSDFKI